MTIHIYINVDMYNHSKNKNIVVLTDADNAETSISPNLCELTISLVSVSLC